jgi:chemotaxis protein methyltransferase CheR
MEALPGTYDLIFFRNALIYFSPENRRRVLDNLIQALADGGSLFVGASETSSVEEDRLELTHHQGAFYFTRRNTPVSGSAAPQTPAPRIPEPRPPEQGSPVQRRAAPDADARSAGDPEFAAEVVRILSREEGRPNAGQVLSCLRNGDETRPVPSGRELAAAALTLLNANDLPSAGMVLSCLEERGPSPVTSFLRGEFYYHSGGEISAAEEKYQEAAAEEQAFWPAYYRISALAEEGNRTRYGYRLKKALESMERGAGRGYEIFIGGFSPDYYRRILERKLAEEY